MLRRLLAMDSSEALLSAIPTDLLKAKSISYIFDVLGVVLVQVPGVGEEGGSKG